MFWGRNHPPPSGGSACFLAGFLAFGDFREAFSRVATLEGKRLWQTTCTKRQAQLEMRPSTGPGLAGGSGPEKGSTE